MPLSKIKENKMSIEQCSNRFKPLIFIQTKKKQRIKQDGVLKSTKENPDVQFDYELHPKVDDYIINIFF